MCLTGSGTELNFNVANYMWLCLICPVKESFILAKCFFAQDSAGRSSQRTQMFSLDGSRPTLDLIPAFLLLTDFYTLVSNMALLTDWEGWRGIYLAGGTEADDW